MPPRCHGLAICDAFTEPEAGLFNLLGVKRTATIGAFPAPLSVGIFFMQVGNLDGRRSVLAGWRATFGPTPGAATHPCVFEVPDVMAPGPGLYTFLASIDGEVMGMAELAVYQRAEA